MGGTSIAGEPSSQGNIHHGENSVARDPFILREPPTWRNPLLRGRTLYCGGNLIVGDTSVMGNTFILGKPSVRGKTCTVGETPIMGENFIVGQPPSWGNLHQGNLQSLHVYALTCAYVRTHARVWAHAGVCLSTHMPTRVSVPVCTDVFRQAGAHAHAAQCPHVCACVCARPCVHTRVCTSALFTLTPHARPLLAGCPLSPRPGHTVPPLPRHTARGPPCPPPARLRPRICYKWFCSACGTAGSSWAASEPEATGVLPPGRGG